MQKYLLNPLFNSAIMKVNKNILMYTQRGIYEYKSAIK